MHDADQMRTPCGENAYRMRTKCAHDVMRSTKNDVRYDKDRTQLVLLLQNMKRLCLLNIKTRINNHNKAYS